MELQILYDAMHQHTKNECSNCKIPYSCCSPDYCEMADDYARFKGVILPTTPHPRLKFMGHRGCTVPPHLRPLCTLHTCDIASLGYKPGDADWTEKYYELRDEINQAETVGSNQAISRKQHA